MITEEIEGSEFCWREREGVRALCCRPLEADGFTNAFSTRGGGVSPFPSGDLNLAGFNDDAAANIHENRRRFLNLFPNGWTLTGCWQVHSADVRIVCGHDDARRDTENCDALVTSARGILLAVKTADCVPILIGDPKRKVAAAVHAGWRGTLASIAQRTVERMQKEFGCNPANMRAAIGPAALGCCYEVGPEVVRAFRAHFTTAEAYFTATRNEHATVDLHAANRDQLLLAGLDTARIHAAPYCTMERTDLFFSYRREKKTLGKTGRLMGVIGIDGE